jgi:hypothetical protein
MRSLSVIQSRYDQDMPVGETQLRFVCESVLHKPHLFISRPNHRTTDGLA